MRVSDLIAALEEMPEDAEVRLAFQPSWPLAFEAGKPALDKGHQHRFAKDPDLWWCEDPDCGFEQTPPDPENPLTESEGPEEQEPVVWIQVTAQANDLGHLRRVNADLLAAAKRARQMLVEGKDTEIGNVIMVADAWGELDDAIARAEGNAG